jgi:hypothetical protein
MADADVPLKYIDRSRGAPTTRLSAKCLRLEVRHGTQTRPEP